MPDRQLFTPFPNLGLIIIDEEHEGAYKSETSPRYHARDVAEKLAALSGAALVMGSATPSVEAYAKAEAGIYRLFTLTKRAKAGSEMAAVEVCGSAKGDGDRQQIHIQCASAGADQGPVGEKGADHAVYQPEGLFQLCFLQKLR